MSFARSVKSPQRLVRMMSLKVDGTGTASLSGTCANDVSLTDSGTGDYLLTFDEAFARTPEVLVTVTTNDRIARVATLAVGSVQIITEDLAGAAADADFHVMIVGSDASDAI